MLISNETLEQLNEQNYDSLDHYFQCLSEDYETSIEEIEDLAEILGESELFDGLISALEDYYGSYA